MRLSFHGADRGVTGSCHLVECNGARVLIDCGLYQGSREIDEDNAQPFGFEPRDVDFLLLTHAHLDHCGRIPLLVRRGFRGEIITTSASRELAQLVLLDAAHLNEEDARRRALHKPGHGRHKAPVAPLYSILDAMRSFEFFGRAAHYDQPFDLVPGIRATFSDAGHILGSASVRLELTEAPRRQTVLFSGDLGNSGRPLLRDPAVPTPSDVVVIETTYGDRLHKPIGPSVEELYAAIRDTFMRGGNVVIPTFALERAQEVLFYLREGLESNKLPRGMPVFLDSPMAISATEIFGGHPECYDAHTARLFHQGLDPLDMPGLVLTRETSESVALNAISRGAVIMAGSGMCTGGRVRHHLKHNLWRAESSVIFVGFAAQGTLARRIIDGASEVEIFGEPVQVRAQLHTINGFSAHADRDELRAWHAKAAPGRTFLVHGEEATMRKFATLLPDTEVELPGLHETFDL
ncbi:MAG TPA: MBL fold metallo-hydrolase [Pseudomonadales bacterium]